jgi:predicted O-linked N-acetylglucosamine transferase (SPINDLY family)
LWARLLLQVSGSRLYLKNRSLDDEDVRVRIMNQFAGLGISNERLILRGSEPRTREHLARYADVDIGLDTFPYCGTTTTCEALWMGVPVVTLEGVSHTSRVGKSLLTAVGHSEWVAGTADEYVDIAAGLAEDHKKLAGLRAGLRGQMAGSILGDATRFTGLFDQAYREMWHSWVKGQSATGIRI